MSRFRTGFRLLGFIKGLGFRVSGLRGSERG